MPVNVLGGPLEFTATVNTDDLENKLKVAFNNANQSASQVNDTLSKVAKTTSTAFNANDINKFGNAIRLANEKIAPLIEKSVQALDPGQLVALQNQLDVTTGDFQKLATVLSFLKDNINSLNLNPDEAQQLSAAIKDIQTAFSGLSDKQSAVVTQLRAIKNELATAPSDSPLFSENVKRAGELEDKIKEVNTAVKLASSNNAGLQAATQAVRGLIGGFEALNGIMGLTSDNNETVEKTFRALIASMGILQGIEEVTAVLEKNSALNVFLTTQLRKNAAVATTQQAVATEGLAVAETATATATKGAAGAIDLLTKAIKANPAGLLLTALTAVISAITIFSDHVKESERILDGFNDKIDEINRTSTELVDNIRSITDITAEQQRNRGDLESQITQTTIAGYKNEAVAYQKSVDEKLAAAKKLINGLTGGTLNTDNIQINSKQDAERALAGLEQLKKAGFVSKSLNDEGKKGFDQIVNTVKEIIGLYDQAANAQNDALKAELKYQEEVKKEALRSARATAEARLILVKKNTSEELKAEIDAINARAKAEQEAGNLTAGEQQKIEAQRIKDIQDAYRKYNLLQLQNEKDLVDAKLAAAKEGSAEELQLKLKSIQLSAKIEQQQDAVTDQKKKLIRAQSEKEQYELIKKYNDQLKQDEVQTTISQINAKLALVAEGSRKELDLKKQAIDAQANLDALNAGQSIKNEKLLQAKLLEIYTDAQAKKQKLSAAFYLKEIDQQLKLIEDQANKKKEPFQQVLDNAFSTDTQKRIAQLNLLKIELGKLQEQQQKVGESIAASLLTGQTPAKELGEKFVKLGDAINHAKDAVDNFTKADLPSHLSKIAQEFSKISGSLLSLGSSLQTLDPKLANTINSLGEAAGVASDFASAASSYLSGDYITAATQAVNGIASIVGIFAKAAESARQAKQAVLDFQTRLIEGEAEYNALLRDRERQQVTLNKLTLQGLRDQEQLLQKQKTDIQKQFDDLFAQLQKEQYVAGEKTKRGRGSFMFGLAGFFSGLGGQTSVVQDLQTLAGKSFDQIEKLFESGQLTDKAKALFEQLQQLKQEGQDVDQILQQNAESLKEIFTGTTSSSITDSIIDGFKNGLRSASDFADTFQDLMKGAMINALKFQTLEPLIQQFFDSFADKSQSDNILTQDEINQLQKNFDNIITQAQQQFAQLQQITGINFGSAGAGGTGNSLQGAIKGITEGTAELIAGQFGGLRLTAIDQLNVLQQNLSQLNSINLNTYNTSERLSQLIERVEYYYGTAGIKIK